MLNLPAVDLVQDPGVYYWQKCPHCQELFIYKSRFLLRAIWDKARFEVDFALHKIECVNNRVERFLNKEK